MERPMSTTAAALGKALLRALRENAPSNTDTPQWVDLISEAKRRGKSPRAFREWCQRRGVPIRGETKEQWVSPALVDAAIAQIPLHPGCTTPEGDTPEVRELRRRGLL